MQSLRLTAFLVALSACSGSSQVSFSDADGGGAGGSAGPAGSGSSADAGSPSDAASPPADATLPSSDGGTAPSPDASVFCHSGEKLCNGSCVSADDPALGCGQASCSACPSAPHGTPICAGAKCALKCAAGYNLCGAACVAESSATCGASCTKCSSNNATPSCVAGRCELSCAFGWQDCDGDPSNGCETDTQNDPNNCGSCFNVCSGFGGCVNGACQNN